MAWIITILASGLSSLAKLVACLSLSQEVMGSIPGLGNFSSATTTIQVYEFDEVFYSFFLQF